MITLVTVTWITCVSPFVFYFYFKTLSYIFGAKYMLSMLARCRVRELEEELHVWASLLELWMSKRPHILQKIAFVLELFNPGVQLELVGILYEYIYMLLESSRPVLVIYIGMILFTLPLAKTIYIIYFETHFIFWLPFSSEQQRNNIGCKNNTHGKHN